MKIEIGCFKTAKITCALLSALITSQAYAEELAAETETEIVITANRVETPIEHVGSSITVIDSEEIERSGVFTVLEILRRAPGVAVTQSGGLGRVTSVFLRGADSDQTLVLVDGVRVNDANVGGFDFSNFKLENIERIEILRGAQSVLYGTQAIGGVINIITKTAAYGTSASAKVRAGSFGTQEYLANVGYGEERFRTSNSVSFLKSDGISAADSSNGNSEDDSYENVSISNKTSFTFLEDGKVDASIRYQRGETEIDGFEFGAAGVEVVDDLNATQNTDLITGRVVVEKKLLSWLTPSISIGVTDQKLEGRDPDNEFGNFEIESTVFDTTLQSKLEVLDNNDTLVGYTYERRDGRNFGNFDEQRDVNSFFVNNTFDFDDFIFVGAGARYVRDSDFGDKVTYRGTLAVLLHDIDAKFHSSVGTGFKAPTFNELSFPFFGNPDLNAETSIGYDLGFEKRFETFDSTFDVTFFYNNFNDLIASDPDTFTAVNIDEANSFGFETSFNAKVMDDLDIGFQHTYTESENEETGLLLPRRPRHRANLNVFYKICDWADVSANYLLVNSRLETNGDRLDNYEKLDITGRSKLNDNISFFVNLDNVFDEDYQEVQGFGTAGFAAYGGVEVKL